MLQGAVPSPNSNFESSEASADLVQGEQSSSDVTTEESLTVSQQKPKGIQKYFADSA